MVIMTSFCVSRVMAGATAWAAGGVTSAQSSSNAMRVGFIVVLPEDRFDSLRPVGQGSGLKVPGGLRGLPGDADAEADALGQGGGLRLGLPAPEAGDFAARNPGTGAARRLP